MPAPTLDRLRSTTEDARRRLLVTRKVDGDYRGLGFLTEHETGYDFDYLESAVTESWFRPLPGLPLDRLLSSETLFPVFASRVMEPKRPDRPAAIARLGLPLDSTPFEILSRSGGRRVGDALEVLQIPSPSDSGSVQLSFFVHGVRHVSREAQDVISGLLEGTRLEMAREPGNRADPSAISVVGHTDLHLGYVPRPLTGVVGRVLAEGGSLVVQKSFGPDVSFHLRLLVQLEGTLAPGEDAFGGPEWYTVPR